MDYFGALVSIVGAEVARPALKACDLLHGIQYGAHATSWCLYELGRPLGVPRFLSAPLHLVASIRGLVLLVAWDLPIIALTELRAAVPTLWAFGVSCGVYLLGVCCEGDDPRLQGDWANRARPCRSGARGGNKTCEPARCT